MSLPEILAKIRKPLEYASRHDFAALKSVQGLDKTIEALVQEGIGVEKDLGKKELLRELRILFLEFDTVPDTDRRRKVRTALETLEQLERLEGVVIPLPTKPAPELEGAGVLPAVFHPQVVPPIETQDDDGEDDRQDDGDDMAPIPVAAGDEIPGSGAGILPAVVPGQGPEAEGDRKRRRRRRGGRRRRKPGDSPATGVPAVASGENADAPLPGDPPSGERPSAARPRLVPPAGGLRPSPGGVAPHPEAGPIRILAAEPPIPARAAHRAHTRPVVRPGDPFSHHEEGSQESEVSSPETQINTEELAAARAAIPTAASLPPAPPPPRIDDLKAALARLAAPITEGKGVGPKIGEMFAELGVRSVEDALFDLPRAYQDRSQVRKISELVPGKVETVMGTVKARGAVRVAGRPGFELIVADDTGEVRAKWFHAHRGMEARFEVGARVIFAGKFERFKDKLEVVHPEIEVLDEEDTPESFAKVTPVYALTDGLGQKTRRKIQAGLVEDFGRDVPPATPYWARQKRSLASPAEALVRLTNPIPSDDVQGLAEHQSPWHRALAYDELFALQVGLALRKRAGTRDRAPQLRIVHNLIAKLAAFLPYPLTDAQEKVLAEIKRDLMQQRPMHRLLQGDVGSGKTIVALMAALIAIENRHQVALMAPTEILAEQHFLFVKSTLERLGVRGALVLGGQRKAEKDEVLKRIAHGEVDLVIGTHALIQEGVQFRNLSLVIIDEQHRFGVQQRASLRQKGSQPHVLIMTATPIPRTLALTEFGDLDVSVIDRLPAGRSPVETRVAGEAERSMVYAQIRSDVSSGRQAFVVYPTVEGDDAGTLASAVEGQKKLQRDVFPEFRVGLLHGQMAREEKEGMMTRFKNGAVDILATTTVVEVGIDVPNATVMLVEHAERFGLAQLHQLRGRVGRGAAKSRCFFMVGAGAAEDAADRMAVLERTGDGFEVAQADLDLRGPGDTTGSRQAGMPPFRVADPLRDLDLMVQAREDAFAMVAADPKLREPEHRVVHEVVKHRWRGRLTLADVG